MAITVDPIIVENDNFTSADSPFVLDAKSFFDNKNAKSISITNDGLGSILVQVSKINGNFGDIKTLKPADVFGPCC